MTFKRLLLAATALVALMGIAAFAQDAKQHEHAAADGASQQMSAKDLKAKLDKGEKVIILDARHELGGQILKGAVHVPSDKLDDWAKTADKNAVIVTYCTCPHDEAADAEMHRLLQMGFKNAYSLTGGMDAARTVGIEVVAPADK